MPEGPTFSYHEFPPSPALAAYVACYWSITSAQGSTAPAPNRVLPDGCIDIIFTLGSPVLRQREGDAIEEASGSYVVGTMQRPIMTWMPGNVALLGVRFLPGGARPFFAPPMKEFTNYSIPLDDLWRGEGKELAERIAELGDVPAGIGIIEKELLRRLARERSEERGISGAVRLLRQSGGGIAVQELERRLGIGERRLERQFAEWVGLSPKRFARVLRFQRAVELLWAAPGIEWMDVVTRCGYFDQPHLVREFRELAGVSPEIYRREVAARVGFVQREEVS